MKRNWIFIAVLCLVPHNLITSASDMKDGIMEVEKKVEEKVAKEFRKVVTLTTYSVTEEETDDSPTITASGFEIDEDNPRKHRIWRGDKADTARAIEEVVELFPRLGERMEQSANTLSGGERQMLAIGRALVSRPKLLLLDEPSLGLAPLVIEQIFQTIDQLRHKLGLTVLLVEQNAMSALEIADIGVIINLGEVVATGPANELINDPALRAAYLGY